MLRSLVGSEMCIRDRFWTARPSSPRAPVIHRDRLAHPAQSCPHSASIFVCKHATNGTQLAGMNIYKLNFLYAVQDLYYYIIRTDFSIVRTDCTARSPWGNTSTHMPPLLPSIMATDTTKCSFLDLSALLFWICLRSSARLFGALHIATWRLPWPGMCRNEAPPNATMRMICATTYPCATPTSVCHAAAGTCSIGMPLSTVSARHSVCDALAPRWYCTR